MATKAESPAATAETDGSIEQGKGRWRANGAAHLRMPLAESGYRKVVPPDSAAEVVGRRVAAGFIDLILVVLVMIVVGLAFGQGQSNSHGASVNLHGASVVVFLILAFAYYATLELLWGQTLGKRLFRIRVVSRRGDKPSAIAIAARTLFRAVDFLPFLYLLGLIAIVASRRRGQRIGDLVARTTVVEAR